jgi:hypothetical protein
VNKIHGSVVARTPGCGILVAILKPTFVTDASGLSAPILQISSPTASEFQNDPSTILPILLETVRMLSVHSPVPPAASNNPHGVCAVGYEPNGTKRPGKFGPDQSEFA